MTDKRVPQPMPYTKAHHLLNPLRGLILSPRKLVSRLNLRPNSRVLELGPGPGYFSPTVARAIPKGTLVLVDIQPEMLDMAKECLDKEKIANVEYRQGDATSLPLESESFDGVFLVSMLGEVPDRIACLREIHRVLKRNGMLSITEFKLGDPDFIGQNEMVNTVHSAGFHVCAQYRGFFHYTVAFARPVLPIAGHNGIGLLRVQGVPIVDRVFLANQETAFAADVACDLLYPGTARLGIDLAGKKDMMVGKIAVVNTLKTTNWYCAHE